MRVVVVDDEADLADMAAASLREAGHHVTVADVHAGLVHVLDACDGADAVLVDWRMPGMTGADIATRLPDHVTVVCWTAWPDLDHIRSQLPDRVTLLSKPAPPGAIIRAMEGRPVAT